MVHSADHLVVVSGASTGIGFDLVQTLAAQSFSVLAGARKKSDLDRLAAIGATVAAVPLDVTDATTIQALAGHDWLKTKKTVSVVNNAGIAVSGPMEAIKPESFAYQFQVNVFGVHLLTQAMLPFIRKTQGRIVNISSVAGLTTAPYLGAYSASKFALEAMTDAYRRELHPFGVHVTAIEPGPIKTPIWEKNLGNKDAAMDQLLGDRVAIYAEGFSKFAAFAEDASGSAIEVENVTDAILRALTEVEPPTRIIVGSTMDVLRAKSSRFFPDRTTDWVIRKIFGT